MTAEQLLREEERNRRVEDWTPYPGAQSLAASHTAREIFFGGARGPGKSWIQRLWLAKMAVEETRKGSGVLKYPTYKGAIFRFLAVDLRDWHSEAEILYCGKLGAKPRGQPREYAFPGGPVIRSGHLEGGGYIHYVGWEIHKGAIDEATHLPTLTSRETGVPECPDYQLLRTGSNRLSPDGNNQFFLTGNPGFAGDRWVKRRFIDVFIDGVKIAPRTTFLDPISGHSRVFINATVFDNPWVLQNDPGYIRQLMELSLAKQQAWIYGNWDAFEGQFFEFDKNFHTIDPQDAAPVIPAHVFRWLSCDWGYAHPCAVHAYAQGLDGRVHVYRELGFEDKIGSYEVGMEIAKAFIRDLQGVPDGNMCMYLSHDAFQKDDVGDRRVDLLRKGIQLILGPESCFILEMSEDEKEESRHDPHAAVRKMNLRRSQATTAGMSITIVMASKNSVDGWDYFRELLRVRQVEVRGEPDAEVIQRLRQSTNSEALVANYLSAYQQRSEVVPKILFHSGTNGPKRAIDTIPEMTFDPKDPEKMLKQDGDDYVDSILYGVMAHRDAQNNAPLSYYVSTQIQEAFQGRPIDMTSVHIMRLQAEEKYDLEFGSAAPMRLGRFAGRGMLEAGVN